MRASVACAVVSLVARVVGQTFSDDTIARVKANLASSASESWELGTRAESLLELDAPDYSVFSDKSLPPPSNAATNIPDVIAIASNTVRSLPEGNEARPLDSGAGGDPPSLGVAVLLAHSAGGANASRYLQAADNQLNYVLDTLPRSSGGAISHRSEEVQLWSDFVYMTPPYIAFYGAYRNNKTILDIAYTQCKAYEKALYDSKAKLWRHISLGGSPDDSFWSTGQGWAAMGMLRVLATMKNSDWAGDYGSQMTELERSVSNILDGMYNKIDRTEYLHHNHVDESSTFLDAAGTTLIAAATYRLSVLRGASGHIPDAERVRQRLVSRIDSDGWLEPVVNPVSFGDKGSKSPEAQAFILQLHAAHREWAAAGSHGANAAVTIGPNFAALLATTAALFLFGTAF